MVTSNKKVLISFFYCKIIFFIDILSNFEILKPDIFNNDIKKIFILKSKLLLTFFFS